MILQDLNFWWSLTPITSSRRLALIRHDVRGDFTFTFTPHIGAPAHRYSAMHATKAFSRRCDLSPLPHPAATRDLNMATPQEYTSMP